jgi:hypothetical protein
VLNKLHIEALRVIRVRGGVRTIWFMIYKLVGGCV